MGFADTANALNNITTQLATLPTENAYCQITNPGYCAMLASSDMILGAIGPVQDAIGNLTDNKFINKLDDAQEHVPKMQYWPCWLMLAWLIWSCFWCYGEATCCGTCCGCYCLFW